MSKSLKIAIIIGGLVFFESLFGLFITDRLPVVGACIIFFTYIVFLVAIVRNLVNFFKKTKESIYQLGIYSLTIILVVVIYFFNIERNLNFAVNYKAREEIVKMIENGRLRGKGLISLPRKYKNLSKSGKVEIVQDGDLLFVRFITYHPFPGEFEGFIYSSNDKVPEESLFFSKGANLEYERKALNWNWFVHD